MLWRVTVVLVWVGVFVTADSVCVVVVVVVAAGSVVQAPITGIKRISFFIVSLMLTKDSPQTVPSDGRSSEFFQARAIGTSRLVLLER